MLATNGHGTASGNLSMGGLPFVQSSTSNQLASLSCGQGADGAITAGHSAGARVDFNAATISPVVWDASTGTTTMQVSEFGVSGTWRFSGSYQV